MQRHQQRLTEQTTVPQVVANGEQLERVVFDYERGVMEFQIGRRVFVPLPVDEVQRLKSLPPAADIPTAPASGSKPGLQWLEWGCWFALIFGIYLFSKGDANQAQFIFRLVLLGSGLVGVILFQVARLLRAKG